MIAKKTTNNLFKRKAFNAYLDNRAARLSSLAWPEARFGGSLPTDKINYWNNAWSNARDSWAARFTQAPRWVNWATRHWRLMRLIMLLAAMTLTLATPLPKMAIEIFILPQQATIDLTALPYQTVPLTEQDFEAIKTKLSIPTQAVFNADKTATIKIFQEGFAYTPGVLPDGFDPNLPTTVQNVEVVSPDNEAKGFKQYMEEVASGERKISELHLVQDTDFRPGLYKVRATLANGSQTAVEESEFVWGVLVVNPEKSIYLPNEQANLGMAVLDKDGRTLCQADLKLTVTEPSGNIIIFDTVTGTITRSNECDVNSVTNVPDYAAGFLVGEAGVYQLELESTIKQGQEKTTDDRLYSIKDSFEVLDRVPFDISRKDTPIRIYPVADYPVNFTVTVHQDWSGSVTELVPADFIIYDISNGGLSRMIDRSLKQKIVWSVNWRAGQTYALSYRFNAPDVSPVIYPLGPLTIGDPIDSAGQVFQEARSWQIASDAACTASVTGNWTDPATWGGICNGGGVNGYPGATANGDTVTINAGITVTLDATLSYTIATIALSAPAATNSALNFNSNINLTTTGAVTLNGSTDRGTSTISIGNSTSTFVVGGLLTINGGAGAASTVTVGTGTLTTSAGVTFSGTTGNAKITTTGIATWNSVGTISGGGATSFSFTSGTNLKTSGTSAINTAYTSLPNLWVTGGTTTLGAAQTTTGVQVDSGAVLAGSTFLLTSTCNSTGTAGFTINGTYSGSGGITLNTASCTLDGSGTVSNTGAFTMTNNKTIAATASLIVGGSTSTATISAATTVTNNGSFTFNGTGAVTGGNATTTIWTNAANSTLTVKSGTTTFLATGVLTASASPNTVNYAGANQTCKGSAGTQTYVTLQFSGSGTKTCAITTPTVTNVIMTAGTWTHTTALTLTGTLTVQGGELVTGAVAFTVNGTTSITGGTLTNTNNTGAKTYIGAVTLNGTGLLRGASTNIVFRGGITNTAGTVTITGRATFHTNSQSLNGTMAIATIASGTGGQTVTNNGNITSSGTAMTLNGSWTQGSGSTLTFSGAITFSGFGGTLNASSNANTVRYTRAGVQTCLGVQYYHLELSGSSAKTCVPTSPLLGDVTMGGTATWTHTGALTINGNLYISGGTLTTGAVAFTVTGTTTLSSGALTLTDNTGAKTFTGAISVSGGTLSGASTNIVVKAGIANTSGTVSITGTVTFNQAGATLSGNGNQSIAAIVVTSPGTVTNTSNNIIMTSTLSGNGTWTQGASGTLTNSLVSASIITVTNFDASTNANTVTYSGAGNQTCRVVAYSSLTLSTSGTKTCAVTTVNATLATSGTVSFTTSANLTAAALTVGTGTAVNAAGFDLTVAGTVTVSGALDFTASTTGTKSLGFVNVGLGGSVANTINEDITFTNGITHNGSAFNTGAGAIIFATNSQALEGLNPMTFGGEVTIDSGITVTNNNTHIVSFSGIVTGADGTASFATGAGTSTQFASTVMSTGTLVPSTSANTVQYTGAGQTVKLPTTNPYYHLNLSGSGSPALSASMSSITGNLGLSGTVNVSTAATLAVGLDVTVATGATFNVNHDLTITGGDFTNAGTGVINHASGTPTVTISGTDGVLGGVSGSTTFYNLVLSDSITFGSNFTVKNNLTTPSSMTASTYAVTMTGTAGLLTGNGGTFYDLVIDPASTGTITVDGGVPLNNTLTVAENGTATLNTASYFDLYETTGTSLVLNGTISGPGVLYYYSSTTFPSTGAISCRAFFYVASANHTIPGRTFGGDVYLQGDSATDRSVIFGTAGSQTITINGHLDIDTYSSGDLTVDATANDPDVVIGGRIDFVGIGAGTEIINAGAGSWSVGGDVSFASGEYNIETGNELKLTGTANNHLNGNGQTLYDLTIDPTTEATIFIMDTDVTVSNLLTVAAGDVMSIDASRTLTLSSTSGTTLALNGTISGSGRLTYMSTEAFPTGGTLSSILRMDCSDRDGMALSDRSGTDYGGDVEIYNNNATFTSVGFTVGTASSQTINFGGNLYIITDNNQGISVDVAAYNPTINITGNLGHTGSNTNGQLTTGSGTWTVSGNIDLTGGMSFSATSGNTIIMNGSTKTLTSDGETLQSFEVSGGSVSTADAADINGTFTVSGGAFTQAANANLNIAGDFTLESGTTFTAASGSGIMIFDGDLTFNDETSPKQLMSDLQIGASPDTTHLASDMVTKSLLVKSAGAFYTHGYDVDSNGDITIEGTFDATDDVETDETIINCAGNFTISSTATYVADQSTLIMDATTGTKDLITDGAFSLYNLTLSDGGGSLVVEVEDALVLNGTLTITGGTLDTKSGENNSIEVGGNWDNDDTFLARSGLVTMNGSSGTKTIDADGTGADAFYDLTFNDGGGSATYQLTTAMDVDRNLTITGGTFDANSNNITIGGNWDNDDTFISGTQTTTFDAASGTKTIDGDGTGTEAFSSVIFNDGGGGATWQLTTLMDVDSDLTITGGTLDFNGSNTLYVGGNFTNKDSILQSTGTLEMNATSGTKYIDTTEATSLANSDFNNITFNDGGGSATYKTKYPLDLDNNLTITGGTLDMTGPTTWYLTNDAYNTEPDYSNWRLKSTDPAGTADNTTICDDGGTGFGQSGICTFQPGVSNTLWNASNPSTIEQTGWMLNNGIPVNGSIAAGTWTLDTTLNYTSGSCGYGVRRLSARLWKADADLTNASAITGWTGNMTVNAGVADYAVTFSGVATQTLVNQVLYVEATMRLGTPACGGTTPTTIVFRVNEGGAKQQLTTPAFTPQINIAGNWDNNDTFTHASGTVVFDASATGKTIEAGASAFHNVNINNASGGWTVQTDNMTVANNLTLTAGTDWIVDSGRTLEVNGNYSQIIAAADTTWTGSTLYLNGSGGMYDINTKNHGGDTYATIRVGATEDIAMWDSSATTYTMDAGGCLFSQDHGATAGRLNIYGTCNSRANEYWSYADDFDGAALGGSSRQADVQFAPSASLTVDSGDSLAMIGQNASSNRTSVSRISTGSYGLAINGTINAQYYDFDYLDIAGLNIGATATVTNLSDGSYDNAGVLNANYITITGATSTLNLFNNVFDSAVDGTDTNVLNNIEGNGPNINWSLFSFSGNKAGEDYDVDENGAFIGWIYSQTLSLSSNSIDFGVLNPTFVASGDHTIDVSTTASGGYSCYVVEDNDLTNGTDTIDDVTGGVVVAGTEAFGLNCSGTDCALTDDSAITVSPLTVANNNGPVTESETTMDYKVAVSTSTVRGSYSNIVTYTCSGNF